MATIKSYSDLEQSRKLAKILPLESADMCYIKHASSDNPTWRFDNDIPPMVLSNISINEITAETLACWSLAALLSVVPEEVSLNSFKDGSWNAMVQQIGKIIYSTANDPVDACCELILKLHEQKLL